MDDDMTIPEFLRTTGPGAACEFQQREAESERAQHRYGQSCWEERSRPAQIEASELRAAVKQYEKEKHFAECEQWRYENPALARMDAKARRDQKRRIAKLGIPPAKRLRLPRGRL
jgi:hypothetical protein